MLVHSHAVVANTAFAQSNSANFAVRSEIYSFTCLFFCILYSTTSLYANKR